MTIFIPMLTALLAFLYSIESLFFRYNKHLAHFL